MKLSTVALTVRIHPSVLQAAKQTAAKHDETISQVIRRALRDYIEAQTEFEMKLGGARPIGRPRKTFDAADRAANLRREP